MSLSIAHVSDTHCTTPELPDADILIHSGDLTIHGFRIEIYRQLCWLESVRHRYKRIFVIPGNHDLYFESHLERAREECKIIDVTLVCNDLVEFEGVKIWGSPHTPNYHSWAYMLKEPEIEKVWNTMPQADVIVTHGPPHGILDQSYRGPIGCPHLLAKILEVKPKLHLFGHAHEGVGEFDNGITRFVNSATKPTLVLL